MALTLPDVEDLDVFSHDETDIFTQGQKEQAIQQAADLMYLATDIEDDPDLAVEQRIVKNGILDMAWKLLITTEHKTDINSPYSSERIGSYSYSKAMQSVRGGVATGVEWFDRAVKMLIAEDDPLFSLSYEDVFNRPFGVDDSPYWATPDNSGW